MANDSLNQNYKIMTLTLNLFIITAELPVMTTKCKAHGQSRKILHVKTQHENFRIDSHLEKKNIFSIHCAVLQIKPRYQIIDM